MVDPNRRLSAYLKDLSEIRAEALRLKRPISWVMSRAWTIARKQIKAMKAPKP